MSKSHAGVRRRRAAGLLAERFGARVVATVGSIAQMHANIAADGAMGLNEKEE